MRLEEAAAVLGVHPDTPIETLKQTYRRLALAWHPDKRISIAYTKLISAQSIGGKRLEDEDSDDDSTGKKGDESHEMAAFMRMFMDLVGIFNEDQSLSEDGKIPAAGVSFGMMFGSRPGNTEEWSTEDEADVEELDDEEDEEEEEEEEDDDEYYDSDGEEHINPDGTIWEPPAKHYSHMNLKEEASKERQSKMSEETEKDNELLEAKRKLKNAKKRVEKRRKQKEKKMRELAVKEEEEGQLRQIEEAKQREEEEAAVKAENDLRLLKEAKIKQRLDLFEVLRSGECDKVKIFVGDTLDIKSGKSSLSATLEQRAVVMRELFASQPLLHCCVGQQLSPHDNNSVTDTSEGRIAIAKYIIGLRNYSVDLGMVDDDGRTALHLAAKKEDISMLKMLLLARDENAEKRSQLDINAKCTKSGWTPLHYAAGQGDVSVVRLLMEAGASLLVHAVTGKGATPLEVVKTRLQNANHFSATHIANLQQVAKELSEAVRNVEKIKLQKEAERLLKEEKLAVERKKLAEREEKERELLERKQKQLKGKQERDRLRDLEEESSKKIPKAGTVTLATVAKVAVPSISSSSSSVDAVISPNITSAPASVTSMVLNIDDTSKTGKKKKKKDKKNEEETSIPMIAPVEPKITVVDVASRDELVNHLLAMGFQESDCLAAISLYGKDLDKSLSWLCDNPMVPKGCLSSSDVISSSGTTSGSNGAVSHNANMSSHVPIAASTSIPKSKASTQSTAQIAAQINLDNEAIGLQKETDHKEELRRINRAWNQKAEDEKKRVDAEKRLKEEERQKEVLLQQQLQKQQHQQLLQQQHLQQMLAQQQQVQQTAPQVQILQRSPSLPYGYNAITANNSTAATSNTNIPTSNITTNSSSSNISTLHGIPSRDNHRDPASPVSTGSLFNGNGLGPGITSQSGIHKLQMNGLGQVNNPLSLNPTRPEDSYLQGNKSPLSQDSPGSYGLSMNSQERSEFLGSHSMESLGLNINNNSGSSIIGDRNGIDTRSLIDSRDDMVGLRRGSVPLGGPVSSAPSRGLVSSFPPAPPRPIGANPLGGSASLSPPGEPVGSSYDVNAYNELRAQAIRMRAGINGNNYTGLNNHVGNYPSGNGSYTNNANNNSINGVSTGIRSGNDQLRGPSAPVGAGMGSGAVNQSLQMLQRQQQVQQRQQQQQPPQNFDNHSSTNPQTRINQQYGRPPSQSDQFTRQLQQQQQQQQLQQQQLQQLRSQSLSKSPLGWEENIRSRTQQPLASQLIRTKPGQSQQIFQSQQQLQEQESSRLHHEQRQQQQHQQQQRQQQLQLQQQLQQQQSQQQSLSQLQLQQYQYNKEIENDYKNEYNKNSNDYPKDSGEPPSQLRQYLYDKDHSDSFEGENERNERSQYNSDGDEFEEDNEEELSIKAKPFVPFSSKPSRSVIEPPSPSRPNSINPGSSVSSSHSLSQQYNMFSSLPSKPDMNGMMSRGPGLNGGMAAGDRDGAEGIQRRRGLVGNGGGGDSWFSQGNSNPQTGVNQQTVLPGQRMPVFDKHKNGSGNVVFDKHRLSNPPSSQPPFNSMLSSPQREPYNQNSSGLPNYGQSSPFSSIANSHSTDRSNTEAPRSQPPSNIGPLSLHGLNLDSYGLDLDYADSPSMISSLLMRKSPSRSDIGSDRAFSSHSNSSDANDHPGGGFLNRDQSREFRDQDPYRELSNNSAGDSFGSLASNLGMNPGGRGLSTSRLNSNDLGGLGKLGQNFPNR